jgi:hypothetical protein
MITLSEKLKGLLDKDFKSKNLSTNEEYKNNSIKFSNTISQITDSISTQAKTSEDNKSTDLLNLKLKKEQTNVHKPMPRELSKKAGISYEEAHRILYSVVGGNTDNRDWSKIMSSKNIHQTAIDATSQFLNNLPPTNDLYLERMGNLVVTKKTDTKVTLGLVTDQGHLLTSLGTKPNIEDFNLAEIQNFANKFGLNIGGRN